MSDKIELFEETNKYNLAFRPLRGSIIGLEGLIGAGKTTAGNSIYSLLEKSGLKVKLFKEYVNEDLLDQYIKNMKSYSYPFQIIMATKRGSTYQNACQYAKRGGIAILDRTLVGDRAFAIMQKNNGNITDEEWSVYESIVRSERGTQPSLILNFDVSPETAYKRMKKRGRLSEVKGYTLEYFENLKYSYEQVYNGIKSKTPLLNIDWNRDIKLTSKQKLSDSETASILYKIRKKIMTIS